jgi:hypothetical protein
MLAKILFVLGKIVQGRSTLRPCLPGRNELARLGFSSAARPSIAAHCQVACIDLWVAVSTATLSHEKVRGFSP